MPVFTNHEELKRFCLNWYFNNVEIVNEARTAPEVPVQEQLTLQEANQLLLIQFKALASRNELSDTEFKNMIELYSILFPYHP